MPTEEHKSKIAASLDNLCRCQHQGESFVESVVTGDGIWIYEFILESKRSSMTWKHPRSPTTKEFKIEPSAKKYNGDRVLGLWTSPAG
jgi:hypothetical protein